MSSSLTWVHLSDWHQRGPDFERQAVRDALRTDLENRTGIDPQLEQVDFVVFSGDLAFSGQALEYEAAAKEFLAPVLEAVNVPRERLYMVPGNHDLSRSTLPLLGRWLDALPSLREINAALIDQGKRQVLLQPMEDFTRFFRAFYSQGAVAEPAFGFLSLVEVRGVRIALVGLNTAWLSGQRIENGEVNDSGVLALGEPQFHDLMQCSAFQQADVRIGVLHHPFSWLGDRFDRSRIEQMLTRGFDFILRGHEHEARITLPNGTDGSCAIISAGAAYDRREGKMNGYNFVHLDLDKLWSTVFLRRYDMSQGYLKDTNTTGDVRPGYRRFRLPRKASLSSKGASVRRPSNRLLVERVLDPGSPDAIDAMELYAARIPAREQVNAPDFIRWLSEDEERREKGGRSTDFLFVCKLRGEVCGFALLHSNPERKLAFVAYLVAIEGLREQDHTISAALLDSVAKLFAVGGELGDHGGILLEVEDPRAALDLKLKPEQLARIRLFSALAEGEKFVLRALDIAYRQPLLHIPREGERGREVPLLLMVAEPRGAQLDRFFGRERVKEFLDFMYGWLYPESFSPIEEENVEYRRYVSEIHASVSQDLPDQVPAVRFAEIQGWSESAAQPLPDGDSFAGKRTG